MSNLRFVEQHRTQPLNQLFDLYQSKGRWRLSVKPLNQIYSENFALAQDLRKFTNFVSTSTKAEMLAHIEKIYQKHGRRKELDRLIVHNRHQCVDYPMGIRRSFSKRPLWTVELMTLGEAGLMDISSQTLSVFDQTLALEKFDKLREAKQAVRDFAEAYPLKQTL